ncbi:MAG: SAM-dependent DNA methyltransferase, partial [Bacteroidia bacterium]|nr:SAM-dependent DNA methyltransferase [Bacteroidia bacterium]
EPIDPHDLTSPWLTLRKAAYQAIRKVAGGSAYVARAGAYTGGTNGVFWVRIIERRPDGLIIIQNLTEEAKVKVEKVVKEIEPDLVYPLLRGRDVRRWGAEPSAWLILTHRKGMGLKAIPEEEIQLHYPKTYGYLKRFEPVLRARAAFKRYFTRKDKKGHLIETGPFYSMFNVGSYTFAPWKVVWREQTKEMTASVVGLFQGKKVIPDHKLMLVEAHSLKEAHFICACINSAITRFIAQSYAIDIQMDTHILRNIRIPKFDSRSSIHRKLSWLSKKAHRAAKVGNIARLQRIEAEIDEAAAQLWGLTPEELQAVQESLRELG